MGKHKEKSHKRKHDESEGPSDESEDDVKKHKEKKVKKHKKEKKSKKDDEEKQLLKAAKRFLKDKLKADEGHADAGQPATNNAPLSKDEDIEEITADDYFIKNAEFSEWLRLHKGLLFNDLTSEQARSHFVEFVEAWNHRALPARFYKGVAGTTLRRTKHAWSIKGGSCADRTAVGLAAAMEEDRNAYSAQRAQDAAERQNWRAEQREALDELLPKATAGREARMDQKMARREAAKDREASPEITRLPGGGDVMGGDDSIAAARAREAKQGEWKARKNMVREEQMHHKLTAAQEAEAEKMAQFRALLAQGPISIARRSAAG